MDFKNLDLKAGLEIHNQLNTGCKLFCGCSTAMEGEVPVAVVIRKQHPVASELGEYDTAAQYEVGRDRVFAYEAFRGETCQVEMDEEPPHGVNQEALETAIAVSLLLNCRVPDEVHVMRKTVIDGSNTTSFQRTMVVGMSGHMFYKGRRVEIDQVSLEEDASAIAGEEGGVARFRLNRLGVPLVEIATGLLEGFTPQEIEEIAFEIGMVVRATGKAKKAIGAIRQDLNVSIKGGARNELKGIQELGMLSKSLKNEVQRQLSVIRLSQEMRGSKIHDDPVSVTRVLSGTKNKMLRSAIDSGGNVYAILLPKFAGRLRSQLFEGKTLGRELADVAVAFGLKGLFHTDEDLSKYGLEEEFDIVKRHLKAGEGDAVVLIGDSKTKGRAAKEVVERARQMLRGVQEGTRSVTSDGSSKFNRPLPGAKRMYPETDIPPVPIGPALLRLVKENLPELLPKKAERIKRKYGLSDDLVREVLRSSFIEIFEEAVSKSKVEPSVVATALVSTAKDIRRREGIDVASIDDPRMFEMFGLVGSGKVAKEAIPDMMREMARSHHEAAAQVAKRLGLEMMSDDEVDRAVKEALSGQDVPEGKAMGIAMARLRGRADPQAVMRSVKKALRK